MKEQWNLTVRIRFRKRCRETAHETVRRFKKEKVSNKVPHRDLLPFHDWLPFRERGERVNHTQFRVSQHTDAAPARARDPMFF